MDVETNLFQQLVESKPVRVPLRFGHNKNIVIESIDFGQRKRNGMPVKANTWIKLSQVDPETRKVEASTEISFFDLDPSKDYVVNNLRAQFSIFAAIVGAVGGDIDAFEESVMKKLGDDIESAIRTVKGAKKAQDVLVNSFKDEVEGKIGLNMPLLKCKLVVNKKGYVNPSPVINWILPMSGEEELPEITSREQAIYDASRTDDTPKVEPDAVGAAPAKTGATSVNNL